MKAHPAAELFPLMDGDEFDALVSDIATHGLLSPIVVHDGRILDGRNRWRACEVATVDPRTAEWQSVNGQSPTDFVVSANLLRRQLTKDQAACVAVGLVPLFAAEAKERQTAAGAHGKEGGRGKAKNPPGNPAPRVSDPAPRARDEAGAAVGVSGRKVGEAMQLQAKAPELFARVKANEMTMAEAKREAFPSAKEMIADADRSAQKAPVVRWSKALSMIADLICSIETVGGIKVATKMMNAEQRNAYKRELIRTANELLAYAEEL